MFISIQQNRAHLLICRKFVGYINLPLPIVIFKKSIVSNMPHCVMHMYICFQQNGVAKHCELHKLAATNSNFEKKNLLFQTCIIE